MRNDSSHEQEWRDWIKLTKRKKSKNEVQQDFIKNNPDIEIYSITHEVRRWTTEDAMPAENFPIYTICFDE